MAEKSKDDKTEKPTAQRLKKARQQGQVVRSRDIATAIGIFVGLKLVVLLMPGYLEDFRRLFALAFAPLDGDGAFENVWSVAFADALRLTALMVLPLAVVPLAIVVGSLVPGGWVLNLGQLQPKFERFNPLTNLGRLFTAKHATDVLTPIAKSIALCFVLYEVCRDSAGRYVQLQAMTLDQALLNGATLLSDGVMALCAVFVVFALLDLPMQVFIFLRGQRMSKRELKDEYKESEGRPEVKQRIRQLQRQLARRGARISVPGADAVIVNPEHYAVAIRYDEKRSDAPFVVAKGVDEMALYIRAIASEHEVPVITMPPLARAIYNTSQINQQIPAALYKAVAQVLNYVLQLKAFRTGRRKAAPYLPDVAVPSHLT